MQLGDSVEQFFSLRRSEADTFDVLDAGAVVIDVVFTELRNTSVRAEQSQTHKRTRQPTHDPINTSPIISYTHRFCTGSMYVLYFAIKTRTSMLMTKHYGWTTRQNALRLPILQLINRTRPYYKNAR